MRIRSSQEAYSSVNPSFPWSCSSIKITRHSLQLFSTAQLNTQRRAVDKRTPPASHFAKGRLDSDGWITQSSSLQSWRTEVLTLGRSFPVWSVVRAQFKPGFARTEVLRRKSHPCYRVNKAKRLKPLLWLKRFGLLHIQTIHLIVIHCPPLCLPHIPVTGT